MNKVKYSSELFLKNFDHLNIKIDPDRKAVWVYLNPYPIPCITRKLLTELKFFQEQLIHYQGKLPYENSLVDIKYHIVTSNHPVFSFGGDLAYFVDCIDKKDTDGLRSYAYSCIDTMFPNHNGFDLGITTISLINGNALGGGLEAALSSHILFAERSADMGLPEVLFNLFPGMGAYNLIAQRVSPAFAEKMISSGTVYSAEELHESGLIDFVVEDGQGINAVNDFIDKQNKHLNTCQALHKIRNIINPIEYQKLLDICDVWVEASLNISTKDLRTMQRLVRSQNRFTSRERNISFAKVTSL